MHVRSEPRFARNRTGSFRPDYVTPDCHRAQNRTFRLVPISAIHLSVTTSRKQTLAAVINPLYDGEVLTQ